MNRNFCGYYFCCCFFSPWNLDDFSGFVLKQKYLIWMEVRFWIARNTSAPNNSHNTIDNMTHSNGGDSNDGEPKRNTDGRSENKQSILPHAALCNAIVYVWINFCGHTMIKTKFTLWKDGRALWMAKRLSLSFFSRSRSMGLLLAHWWNSQNATTTMTTNAHTSSRNDPHK